MIALRGVLLIGVVLQMCSCTAAVSDKSPDQKALDGKKQAFHLADFRYSPHFDEQIREYEYEPDVKVHINAPSAESFDESLPTRVVFFALPNGNSTAQTIGRVLKDGMDWHFDIQHIGAQTRYLRERNRHENLVVVYVEAGGKSWPSWRKNHESADSKIAGLVDSVRQGLPVKPYRVDLSGHSGGGSFVFGFINAVEAIPDWVGTIAFLDANYGFSDELEHGRKLSEWLRRGEKHRLCVIAYDDRNVRFKGKLIVGPTGGTYRKSQKMIASIGQSIPLSRSSTGSFVRHVGLNGRCEFVVVENPENAILHTVLVEKNGFIHAMSEGVAELGGESHFWEPRIYSQWIQE